MRATSWYRCSHESIDGLLLICKLQRGGMEGGVRLFDLCGGSAPPGPEVIRALAAHRPRGICVPRIESDVTRDGPPSGASPVTSAGRFCTSRVRMRGQAWRAGGAPVGLAGRRGRRPAAVRARAAWGAWGGPGRHGPTYGGARKRPCWPSAPAPRPVMRPTAGLSRAPLQCPVGTCRPRTSPQSASRARHARDRGRPRTWSARVPGGLVRGVRAPAAHLQPSCRYPLHTHCDTHRSPGDARTGPDQGAQSARAPAPPGGLVRWRAGPRH
jgi:hypothetical protein